MMVHLKLICLAVIVLALPIGKADECKTPNNETANCVSLYDCPLLLNALTDPATRSFVLQSNCGGTPIEPKVCCGSRLNVTIVKDEEEPKRASFESLLPITRICGLQHSDDFFHTVNSTPITEFPWLALIEHKDESQSNFKDRNIYRCSASLINTKYVLTAAQCLVHPVLTPIRVRLGEYHIANETDCMLDSSILECSDSVQDFGIEKIIPHLKYIRKANSPYDIGLIRLNRTVIFSDYIRPICLPLLQTKRAKVGDTLYTSGWGKLKSNEASAVKKKTYSIIITSKECEAKYLENRITLTVEEGRMCGLLASGSEVICQGDGGGPVMYSYKNQWYQEGIVSFGSSPCSPDYPEVYTNVSYFLNWIEDNLEE